MNKDYDQLLKYIVALQSYGTPFIKSKNNENRITIQWLFYNSNYYLWIINGGKRILKINEDIYIDKHSLILFPKGIVPISIKECIVSLENKLPIISYRELIIINSDNVIDINLKLECKLTAAFKDNTTDYFFKVPVDSKILKLFDIKNENESVIIENESLGIKKTFVYSYYNDGFIYSYEPQYTITGLSVLIPRIERKLSSLKSSVDSSISFRNAYKEQQTNKLNTLLNDVLSKLRV